MKTFESILADGSCPSQFSTYKWIHLFKDDNKKERGTMTSNTFSLEEPKNGGRIGSIR